MKSTKKNILCHRLVRDMFQSDPTDMNMIEFLGLLRKLFNIKNKWKNVLYIDIPFCKQRCNYCAYFRGIASGQKEINKFCNKFLIPQIRQFTKVLENQVFYQVQFGGGTPTLVTPLVLENIFKKIPNFDKIPVKIIEASPDTLTDGHINLFAKYAFTNISIGVQTFSPDILRKQNRPLNNKKKLKHFCKMIERYGMISNIDLMFFLEEGKTNLKQEKEDLEYALAVLRPIEIVIHCKYGVVNNKKSLYSNLTKILKNALAKHPEYICVNSLLKKSDMMDDPCLRLMRNRFDYLTSYQAVRVHPANYGYNTLALGDHTDNSPLYASFYDNLILYNRYCTARVLNWEWASVRYKEFLQVRKKRDLPYHKFEPDDFFIKTSDKKKCKTILKKLQSLMVLDKYLNKKLLKEYDYYITNIDKVSDSSYQIEFEGKKEAFSLNLASTKHSETSFRTNRGYYLDCSDEVLTKKQRCFAMKLAANM